MGRKKNRHSWLLRVAVSYGLVFTVPFLLFVLGSWYFFSRISESEIESYAKENLARSRALFDREMQRMTSIGERMAHDADLRYFTDFDDPLGLLALEKKLTIMVEIDPFFTDILYYEPKRALFVGSKSVYGADAVIRQYLNPIELSAYALHQTLIGLDKPRFLFLDRVVGAEHRVFFVYAYPLSPIPELASTVLFIIPTEKIERIMGSDLREEARTRLYDPDGDLVHALGGEMLAAGDRAAFPPESEPRRFYVRGIVHKRFSDFSKVTGFALIRDEPMLAAVRLNPRLALLALMSVGVLAAEAGILLIVFRFNYRPLVRLVKDIEGWVPSAVLSSEADEIGRIRGTIDVYRVHERLRSFLYGASADFPFEVLSGTTKAPDEKFGAVLVTPPLETTRSHEWVVASFADPEHRREIIIVRIGAEESPERAIRRIADEFGVAEELGVAAGSFSADVGDLPRSLHDAEESMAHLAFYGLRRVSSDELGSSDHDVELPIIRAAALRTELEKDDPAEAPRLLESLAEALAAVRAPVRIVHALYWELCFVFRREFAKRGCCDGAPDALSEREPVTLHDFVALFADRCTALIAAKAAARSHFEKSQNRADRIRSRIERACVAPDYTLHPIMEEERLTASALSNLFKNAYGETITDFVGRTRIEKAKELLAAGTSVKEVVARIGYQDATSFIRKFKGITGLTPKEWAETRYS